MAPSLTYSQVIAGTEGPKAVPVWVELAELLDNRDGRWTFQLLDGQPRWTLTGTNAWCTAEQVGARPPQPVAWLAGDDPDDAWWWEADTAAALTPVLDDLEAGRLRPPVVGPGAEIKIEL